jgi:hypothetical protein
MAQSSPDLIDRQELLRVIRDHVAKLGDASPLQTADMAYIAALVAAMPAVDAVPVVRCQDCKFRHSGEFCECRPADAFCSDGERRAGHEQAQ